MGVDWYTDLVGRKDVSWPRRCSEVRGNQGKVWEVRAGRPPQLLPSPLPALHLLQSPGSREESPPLHTLQWGWRVYKSVGQMHSLFVYWFVNKESDLVFVYYYSMCFTGHITLFFGITKQLLCVLSLQKTNNAILWTHNSNVSSKCGGECDDDEVRQSEAPGKASLGTNSTCTWYLGVVLEGPLRPCASCGRGGEMFCAPNIRTVRWPGCLQ